MFQFSLEEIAINCCKYSHFLCKCRSQYVVCVIDHQEYSVAVEDKCIKLNVLEKYFKSSVIHCILDLFVSKLISRLETAAMLT